MTFYYFSIFSLIPLGVVYGVLGILLLAIARPIRNKAQRNVVLLSVGFLFLFLPISEEFWVAWTFGQACKIDGTTIHKKVEVAGFYDDTRHWWRQLKDSSYQFVESRDRVDGRIWRVERVNDEIKHFAIDRPTARYHFSIDSGIKVSHKVHRQTASVVDTQSGELLGQYARYHREAPWFFLSLGRPNQECKRAKAAKQDRHTFLIYQVVLLPLAAKEMR